MNDARVNALSERIAKGALDALTRLQPDTPMHEQMTRVAVDTCACATAFLLSELEQVEQRNEKLSKWIEDVMGDKLENF